MHKNYLNNRQQSTTFYSLFLETAIFNPWLINLIFLKITACIAASWLFTFGSYLWLHCILKTLGPLMVQILNLYLTPGGAQKFSKWWRNECVNNYMNEWSHLVLEPGLQWCSSRRVPQAHQGDKHQDFFTACTYYRMMA